MSHPAFLISLHPPHLSSSFHHAHHFLFSHHLHLALSFFLDHASHSVTSTFSNRQLIKMKSYIAGVALLAGLAVAQDLSALNSLPPCGVRSGPHQHLIDPSPLTHHSKNASPTCWRRPSPWAASPKPTFSACAPTVILAMASMIAPTSRVPQTPISNRLLTMEPCSVNVRSNSHPGCTEMS